MLKKSDSRITKIEPASESNPTRPRRSDESLPEKRRREDPKPFADKLDKAITDRLKKP